MKPEDDPWLKSAHKNAEHLAEEIKKLSALTEPIRSNLPIMTKYQDFWNQAKQVTGLFKELKPLAHDDRDLLWKQFNTLCREVKEHQKSEYGTLESVSRGHFDEIMKQVELAGFPTGTPLRDIHELVEHGQVLKNAGELLAKYKQEMLAKHKKTCFDRIQKVRTIHDSMWDTLNAGKAQTHPANVYRIRRNLENNQELYRKAAGALENFQIGAGHIRTYLATCDNPEKRAEATARLAESEARIKDIEEGMKRLRKWIADDERLLKGE